MSVSDGLEPVRLALGWRAEAEYGGYYQAAVTGLYRDYGLAVTIDDTPPQTNITQLLVASGRDPADKRETLRGLIRSAENFKNAIVFCNRKREVAQLHRSLVRHGFNAAALHGDMDQAARTTALESFRQGDVTLLIASDVAARGLDIPDVSHVFN